MADQPDRRPLRPTANPDDPRPPSDSATQPVSAEDAFVYDPGTGSPYMSPAERSRRMGDTVSSPASGASQRLPVERVAHFRVIGKIGEGGMGVVYRALDEYLQRTVALKVLAKAGGTAADDENTQRLLREARAASRINHPNVVTVFAAGEFEGTAFIAMEYVEGRELADLIGAAGFDTERALAVALQIAEGLGAAHAQGIVHRDIKPANVLVLKDDRVKILDFGLAKPVRLVGAGELPKASADRLPTAFPDSEDSLSVYRTQAGVVWGSLHYMSPEQACGDPLDARSDVFSLGVVLYQILAGRLPFHAAKPKDQLRLMLYKEPEPLSAIRMRIPASVERIVARAMSKDRDLRYPNGDAMAADLRTALSRIREFGDTEFEDRSASVEVRPSAPELPAPAAPSPPTAPVAAEVRYDRSFPKQTLAFYDAGAHFDLVIHTMHAFDWQPRTEFPGGGVAAYGTAINIRGEVFELVEIDSSSSGMNKFCFRRWPEAVLIRRVIPYTPAYVAEQMRAGRTTGSIGERLTGFFKRKE